MTNVASGMLETADVVDHLETLIHSQGLQPGDRLPSIRDLALRFGVKAGTVRDALLDAQGKGLVRVLPRVGAIVQSESNASAADSLATNFEHSFSQSMGQPDQNLFHILDTREVLELTLVARAAQRRELSELYRLRKILTDMAAIPVEVESAEYAELDVEFHLEIGRLAGNTVMTSLLEILLHKIRPHLDRIRWSQDRRLEANESHARIYSALAAGNAEQARSEMHRHIRTAYDSLLDEMRQPPTMNHRRKNENDS